MSQDAVNDVTIANNGVPLGTPCQRNAMRRSTDPPAADPPSLSVRSHHQSKLSLAVHPVSLCHDVPGSTQSARLPTGSDVYDTCAADTVMQPSCSLPLATMQRQEVGHMLLCVHAFLCAHSSDDGLHVFGDAGGVCIRSRGVVR